MKTKYFLYLILLTCLTACARKQGVITYQFQKRNTVLFDIKQTDSDGKNVNSKVRMYVREAKAQDAQIEFTTTDISSAPTGNQEQDEMIQNIVKEVLGSSSTIIQFEDGKPTKVVNLDEIKASVPKMVESIFNSIPNDDPETAEAIDIVKNMTDFLSSTIKSSITDELLIAQYADFILYDVPAELGDKKETAGEVGTIETSLKATNNPNEFSYKQVSDIKLNKEQLKKAAAGEIDGLPNDMKTLLKSGAFSLILSMLDDIAVKTEREGIIMQDGTPKNIKKTVQTSLSMMGEKTTTTESMEITRQ